MSNPPRQTDVVLSRPFIFVNFTSSDANDGLLLPTKKDPKTGTVFVPPDANRPQMGSYVYLFVTSQSFLDLPEQPVWSTESIGPGENPLFMAFRLTSKGLLIAAASDIFSAASSREFPTMQLASSAGEVLIDSRLRYFAVGSSQPLTEVALSELKTLPKDEIPHFDLFSGDLPRFSLVADATLLALPVFDPVVIALGLTKKYALACDMYLGHSRKLDPPQLASLSKRAHPAQIELLQKAVADTIQGLRKAANVDKEIDLPHLEGFLKKYEENTETLRKQREKAAFNLIKWLEGKWMTRVEGWGWNADGTLAELADATDSTTMFVKPYKTLLDVVTQSQERLGESDTGVAYVTQTYERAKAKSDGPGVLRTLGKFVLADQTQASDILGLARESIVGVFGAWTSYFEVKLGHIALATEGAIKVDNHTRSITKMREYTTHMLTHITVVVGDEIVESSELRPVKLTVPFRVQKAFKVLKYDPVQLKLRQSMAGKLEAMNLKVDRVQAAFSLLNIALTYGSLREAVREENIDAATWSSAFDLAESVVFFGDQLQKAEGLRRFRTQLLNAPNSSRAVSARLGMLGAGMALAGSTAAALDNYANHDWDAAAAEATQGAGAIVTAVGYCLILSTPQGGPLGGYFLVAGTVISIGGLIWCAFAKDTPYDILAKFSFFGKEFSDAKDIKAPGWALCKTSGTLADWNPDTIEGLTTYLKAAEQLFYSFRLRGVDPPSPRLAADGGLRILPSAIRPASIFRMTYRAKWVRSKTPFSGIALEHSGECTIEIGTADQPDKTRFRDSSGTFVEEGAAMIRSDGGADVIDVAFRLKEVAELVKRGAYTDPFDLLSLSCSVKLDVHGDEQSIVPTTSKGARSVDVICFENRTLQTDEQSSHADP